MGALVLKGSSRLEYVSGGAGLGDGGIDEDFEGKETEHKGSGFEKEGFDTKHEVDIEASIRGFSRVSCASLLG